MPLPESFIRLTAEFHFRCGYHLPAGRQDSRHSGLFRSQNNL
jgi:hypothetical protein